MPFNNCHSNSIFYTKYDCNYIWTIILYRQTSCIAIFDIWTQKCTDSIWLLLLLLLGIKFVDMRQKHTINRWWKVFHREFIRTKPNKKKCCMAYFTKIEGNIETFQEYLFSMNKYWLMFLLIYVSKCSSIWKLTSPGILKWSIHLFTM